MFHDLRLALRSLLRSPGFTLAAVATFALGIGANATVFGVVNAVLLRAYPFREPERLVQIFEKNARGGDDRFAVSPANARDWRERARSFEGIAVYGDGEAFTLRADDGSEPERLSGAVVTADFFRVLGVSPLVGRAFLEGEDRPGAPSPTPHRWPDAHPAASRRAPRARPRRRGGTVETRSSPGRRRGAVRRPARPGRRRTDPGRPAPARG